MKETLLQASDVFSVSLRLLHSHSHVLLFSFILPPLELLPLPSRAAKFFTTRSIFTFNRTNRSSRGGPSFLSFPLSFQFFCTTHKHLISVALFNFDSCRSSVCNNFKEIHTQITTRFVSTHLDVLILSCCSFSLLTNVD